MLAIPFGPNVPESAPYGQYSRFDAHEEVRMRFTRSASVTVLLRSAVACEQTPPLPPAQPDAASPPAPHEGTHL